MRSYHWWYFQEYPFFKEEKHLEQFLNLEQIHQNWIRFARNAMFLSSNSVAQKLGVSTQAYCRIERAEPSGKITIEKLQEIAAVMDCNFIYCLVPKSKQKFSQVVWKKLENEVLTKCKDERLTESRIVRWRAGYAGDLMLDAKFRNKKNWSRRKRISSKAP